MPCIFQVNVTEENDVEVAETLKNLTGEAEKLTSLDVILGASVLEKLSNRNRTKSRVRIYRG